VFAIIAHFSAPEKLNISTRTNNTTLNMPDSQLLLTSRHYASVFFFQRSGAIRNFPSRNSCIDTV